MRLRNNHLETNDFLFYSNENGYIYQNSSNLIAQSSNYDLSKLSDLILSKSERKLTNSKAKSLLNKPIPELSNNDKSILAQYTGLGGLDKSEYGSLSQHYTDYSTVRAIYKAIKDSGFKFNNVLEPPPQGQETLLAIWRMSTGQLLSLII